MYGKAAAIAYAPLINSGIGAFYSAAGMALGQIGKQLGQGIDQLE